LTALCAICVCIYLCVCVCVCVSVCVCERERERYQGMRQIKKAGKRGTPRLSRLPYSNNQCVCVCGVTEPILYFDIYHVLLFLTHTHTHTHTTPHTHTHTHNT